MSKTVCLAVAGANGSMIVDSSRLFVFAPSRCSSPLTPLAPLHLPVSPPRIVKSVEAAKDPFAADAHKDNPWVVTNTGGGGCCTLQ